LHKRIHRPLAQAVVETLYQIFSENRKADRAIQATLKSNRKWGSKDRAFIALNSYEVVRWWRLLHHYNGSNYEIHKDNATLWRLLGISLIREGYALPHWKEFASINTKVDLNYLKESLPTERAILQSIPDWMDKQAYGAIGEKWSTELAAMNKQASVFLRVNDLNTTHSELKLALLKEKIETEKVEGVPSALRVTLRKNLFATTALKKGFFEVQDAGSQQIAPFLEVAPGIRVIDACAGAGGKTLHLATLMKNKGSVIAMDIHEWKLKELKLRARRNGIHNIEGRVIENSKTIKRLAEKADRLLLDVPCSGLGVLRRNPDSKWKMRPEFLAEVKKIQADIIQRYSKMVKPGGKMVYATCSILPEENELQVQKFLKEHNDFVLENEKHISPAESGFDGFYMARLSKA
jgi:16S rRNA (cytosine967-C5)-methyltransferase